MQTTIVIALFLASMAYLTRLIYQQFTKKNSCATGCGKCGAIDFETIEKQMKAKEKSAPI